MLVKELELISANEDEQSALQKMEGVLNREIPSSQPIHSSLPRLIGPEGETFEIPISVFRVLQKVVDYMMHGKALSVIPHDQLFGLQEAADFLNVSRSFVAQLLDADIIPFVKVGTHRCIRFCDLIAYKNHRDEEMQKAIEEIAHISEDEGLYD